MDRCKEAEREASFYCNIEHETMNRFTKLLLCAAAICFFSGIARADTDISVVALTGQMPPGVAGASFTYFSPASVNNSGEIAFQGRLSDGTNGIFKLSQNQLSLVALSGQSIDGSSGLTFGTMGSPVINDAGIVAFYANIQGGMPNLQGIFVVSGTSISELVDTTTPVSGGAGGQTISSFTGLQFNNRGDVAVSATLAGSAPGFAVLAISNGVISFVSTSAANVGTSFSLNNAGEIAFIGQDGAIYLFSVGQAQLIIQSGQSVPNTNLTLSVLGHLSLNDQRDIVFMNSTCPSPMGCGAFHLPVPNAVIKWSAGILQKIIANGDPFPATANATLATPTFGPLVDNSGRVFFMAELSTTSAGSTQSEDALFLSDSGNLTLLMQEGQVLDGVGKFTLIGSPQINNSGLVTFFSSLENGSLGLFDLNALVNKVFFPEVADGGYAGQWSWRTALMLSNRDSSGPASVSVSYYNDDGTPMNVGINGTTASQFIFSISSSGTLQVETSGTGNLKKGWAEVQSDKSLSGISIFSFYDDAGNYVSEMGAPATSAMTSFSMFIESTPDINTGIAIANPNSSPAQVTLTLRDSQGNATGSPVTVTVPATGHVQGFVTDLFPQGMLAQGFSGTLDAVSQMPVVGMSERQRGQYFTWLPLIQ